MSETPRIEFLIARDGEQKARAWALDAARTYRITVLSRFTDKPRMTLYRRQLIASYLQFKRFAFGEAPK